jgi:hypothetical protein
VALLVGADKSDAAGSADVGAAPPGSRLAGAEAITVLGPNAPAPPPPPHHITAAGGGRAARPVLFPSHPDCLLSVYQRTCVPAYTISASSSLACPVVA